MTIVQESAPGKFETMQTIQTQRGARTMTIDPQTGNIYLSTVEFGPAPEPTVDNPSPRTSIVNDSFMLLMIGR